LLAHGLAVKARPQAAVISIVLNLSPVRTAMADEATAAAARVADGMQNRLFLDAILKGGYPVDVLEHLARHVELDHIHDGDEALIGQPIDLLGVNYYQPITIASAQPQAGPTEWPGAVETTHASPKNERTALGWDVDADGLEELLLRLRDEYGSVPLLVTENGAAYDDQPDPNGYVRDTRRVAFLDQHVRAAHRATEAGVELRGYFVWSLLDNFEWADGYAPRFGLVYVNYETQRRIPKESARWYRRVIAANGLVS
jgi:beta-glucosidase